MSSEKVTPRIWTEDMIGIGGRENSKWRTTESTLRDKIRNGTLQITQLQTFSQIESWLLSTYHHRSFSRNVQKCDFISALTNTWIWTYRAFEEEIQIQNKVTIQYRLLCLEKYLTERKSSVERIFLLLEHCRRSKATMKPTNSLSRQTTFSTCLDNPAVRKQVERFSKVQC